MTDRRTTGAIDPNDDRDAARHYVNRIDLDISLSEIRIDLGQAFPGEPLPRPQCRLVTSPSHLRTFESAIVSGIRAYESRFGTVLTEAADGGRRVASLGAIDSVGESIALLLQKRRALLAAEDRLGPVPAAEDIRHHALGTLTGTALPTAGLSIACYHIGYSDSSPTRRVSSDPGASHGISLELSYLVTSWSARAADEIANLSWAMLELNRFPVLDRSLLTDAGGWARDEAVQIVPEDAAPEQIQRLWDALKQRVRLTALFRARVVRIGYGPIPDGPPVVASRLSFEHGDPALAEALA